MKFQVDLLVLTLLAIANPLADPDPEPLPAAARPPPEPADLGPRTCKLTGEDLKYRKCPSTDNKKCPALGQYVKRGTLVALKCYTYGSNVKGNG